MMQDQRYTCNPHFRYTKQANSQLNCDIGHQTTSQRRGMYFSQQYIMCIHRLIAPQPFQGERQIFADEVERHETRKGSHYYTRACEGAPSYSSERACPCHVRAIHEPAKVLRRIVVRGLAPVMPACPSHVRAKI